MKRLIILIFSLAMVIQCFAARKALLIGNANYAENRLANPINDTRDLAEKLRALGFETTLLTDLDKEQFETAIDNFSRSLGVADESIFYYAGHGVQVEGINYLIPVKAKIEQEFQCKHRAVNTSYILDALSKSKVSIIILDACRNNPYTWRRSGVRGLAPIDVEFGGQFVIYSTSAGAEAQDGDSKNSPFAASLIQHITTPGLSLDDLIRNVGSDLRNYRQIPAVYGFLSESYYFARSSGGEAQERRTTPRIETAIISGSIEIESDVTGDVYLDGAYLCTIEPALKQTVRDIPVGSHELELHYAGQNSERALLLWRQGTISTTDFRQTNSAGKRSSQRVFVERDQTIKAQFLLKQAPDGMVYVPGGVFTMGNRTSSGDNWEFPAHSVTLNPFYLGIYEVTLSEWQKIMGSDTALGLGSGPNHPVWKVSWYGIIKYCNLRSMREELTPVYSINGSTDPGKWGSVPTENNATWNAVICNWNANGYRLPTEAEWEYAARSAQNDPDYQYSGSNNVNDVAWFLDNNTPKGTKPVGQKAPNTLGLYDMSGNVWEWCWDWYSSTYYGVSPNNNPTGPASGTYRIPRGGACWDAKANCRVAARGIYGPPHDSSHNYFGFRLCRSVK